MERKKNEIIRQGICLLFALSFALLCFYQIVYYETWIIYCTVIGSAVVGFLLIRKTGDEMASYICTHRSLTALYLLAALIIIVAMRLNRGVLYLETVFHPLPLLGVRFFRFRWMLCTTPAVFYLLMWFGRKAAAFLSSFWERLEPTDRKLYIRIALVTSTVVLIAYTADSIWFLQQDHVNGLDSKLFLNRLSNLSYYYVTHPMMSILTFPVWAVIHTVLGWVVPSNLLNTLCVVCIQFINIHLLLLTGFMLRELSGSRWVLPLYLVSFPVLLFAILFEKYPLAVFFMVLYVYHLCRREIGGEVALFSAAGIIATSAFLYMDELIQKEPLSRKIKRFFYIFLIGLAVLICTGRIHLLDISTLLTEQIKSLNQFGNKGRPLESCIFSLTNMTHSIFFGLFAITGNKFFRIDILKNPSYFGVVVFIVMALGLLAAYRDRFTRICAIWVGFSVFSFCVVQWSVQESPLFILYFAWAFLPLFQKGFQFIVDKMRWNERIAYGSLIMIMFIVNLSVMIDIGKFLHALK